MDADRGPGVGCGLPALALIGGARLERQSEQLTPEPQRALRIVRWKLDQPRPRLAHDLAAAQYHLPFAKPPKAIKPTRVMMSPSTKLQTNITTMPTMTRMPPRPIPP